MLKSRLPPMDNLVAFEAAARLVSFTKAAAELNVTQAAVSQQIKALEQALGLKLFERAHRAVRLTSAGREYQHTVSAALRHLAGATGDIKLSEDMPRLTIACDQSIAALCLMPRLNAFKTLYSDIALRLIVSDNTSECLADETEVAIIHGDGDWPGYASQLLFAEEVFPVCSPQYLEKSGSIGDLHALASRDLLNLDDEQWDWMTWRIWFNAKGVDLPFERRSFEINSYPLVLEAARNNQGIALGWRCLIDDALEQGQLVKALNESVATEFGYYLVWPERYERSTEALEFCTWISSALTRSKIVSNKIHR